MVDTCLDRELSDLGYAHGVLLLIKDSGKLQVFISQPNDKAYIFRTHFTILKCKILPQDFTGSKANRFLVEENLGKIVVFHQVVLIRMRSLPLNIRLDFRLPI